MEQLAEEKKKLQKLQRQRAEQALTDAFLLKEQKHRDEMERKTDRSLFGSRKGKRGAKARDADTKAPGKRENGKGKN